MRSFSLVALAALFIGFAAAAPVPAPQLSGLTAASPLQEVDETVDGSLQGLGLGQAESVAGLLRARQLALFSGSSNAGDLLDEILRRQELSILEDRQELSILEDRQELSILEDRQELSILEDRQELSILEDRQELSILED